MYNHFAQERLYSQANESYEKQRKEQLQKENLYKRNLELAANHHKRIDELIDYRIQHPLKVDDFVFSEKYFKEVNGLDYKMDTTRTIATPVFKVAFKNERERVKQAEEQNKLLVSKYEPDSFVFRARDRSKEIQPGMHFRNVIQDNQPRSRTPQTHRLIKPGDIIVRDSRRKIASINGTPIKRSQEQLPGVLDASSGEGNTLLSNRNKNGQDIADSRNPSRKSTLKLTITQLGRSRLGSSSKERPNFKSIQQAYLNPNAYYYDKAMKIYEDTLKYVPQQRTASQGISRVDLTELVRKNYPKNDKSMNYDEISGGSIDDPYLYGERNIVRRMKVNVGDLRDDIIEARERTENAKLVLESCGVKGRRHRNVKPLAKGAGLLVSTNYIH